MKAYILFQTDIWKTKTTRVPFGIYSTYLKALQTAKEKNLCGSNGDIEIIECEIDRFEEL